ncbi:hypothetical protein ACQKWADRAFT_307697 [Trichoderma austrokoningii]
MGIDAGFDMDPPLSKGVVDKQNWGRFIDVIKEQYKNDTQVEIMPNYINFKAGEHPKLPFEGHKFLRFSSQISGTIASSSGVERYINTITRAARAHFGSRVQYWNEGADQYGVHDWKEVHESIKSYEQPDDLEIQPNIAQFLSDADPIKEQGITLFEIQDIPGRGGGIIARFNIPKGTRIICEKPLLTVGPMSPHKLESFIAKELKGMSKTSQRQFLSLHNNFRGSNPFSGIFRTNALPCGPGSPIGGIYPTACFINHCCIPNAHNNWNGAEGHETIYATRSIEKGEEITIFYDRGGGSKERRAFLKDAFGFQCDCSGCCLPPDLLKASDNRRMQIQRLDKAIGNSFRMMNNPHESLSDCNLMLNVLDQEFDGCASAMIARLYYDAFQISIAHGDQARASIFAERAYEARLICEGEDSPATLRVKSLAVKPADHSSFKVFSRKWQTTKDSVPKGLNTVQFNKWLFRQEN